MTTLLRQAMRHQQTHQLEEAIALYQDILLDEPDNADALHGLGLTYAQQDNILKAIEYLKKAVDIAPSIPAFHNNLGNAYKKAKQFEAALTHYFEALRLKTPYPEVHNNLGGLYVQQGKVSEAILQFEKSLRMQPQSADTHYNLANCYVQNNRLLEAIPHFKSVLTLRPSHVGAMHNLSMAFSALKQWDEAYPLLKQVYEWDSNNVIIAFQLAIIEASLGHYEASKSLYLHILKINPYHSEAHHNLATLYLQRKNEPHHIKWALNHYHQALSLNPDNTTAQHMIDALMGKPSPKGAPPSYVAALFDQYAYSYNVHMTEQLQYQVPLLLREAVAPFAFKLFKILDLGCGTGLCAPYFIDIADKITGVDISANMLALARAQGGYHRLILSDIQQYLTSLERNTFELILAADVFVYFSDLNDVLKACEQVLCPLGLMAFSIENLELCDKKEDLSYALHPSGRYRHYPESVIAITLERGLYLKHRQTAILRYEDNVPVEGTLFIFSK